MLPKYYLLPPGPMFGAFGVGNRDSLQQIACVYFEEAGLLRRGDGKTLHHSRR